MTRAVGCAILGALVLCAGGCEDSWTEPSSLGETNGLTQAGPAEPAVSAEEPAGDMPPPDPLDDIAVRMAESAGRFAEGLVPATDLLRGRLENGERHDFQAILHGGRCFRVLGVGETSVSDLDLFLFDPNGVQLQQDTAQDSSPVLGLADPLCPERPGAYRLHVRMFTGRGAFGVQVFQTR